MLSPNRLTKNNRMRCILILISLVLAACNDESGKSEQAPSGNYSAVQKVDFSTQVLPLLERRCVHCHACYDAPCQLKLSSREGIQRGANNVKIYDATRVVAAAPTRLFLDAHGPEQWRNRGFFPVVPDPNGPQSGGAQAGLLGQVLRHKQEHPLPLTDDGRLQDVFDLSLNRDWHCPQAESYSDYAEDKPFAGMPFALPALNADETEILNQWLGGGAQMPLKTPALSNYRAAINRWEEFLNQDSPKAQLVARYIYEHLYLANLYFPDISDSAYFKLYRSSTPPGVQINPVATRRPFDDPGTKRVYYRLQARTDSIVAKTHMPYRLDQKRMDRFKQLFFEEDYQVSRLPGYDPETASNPFITFAQIPGRSRYRFLLEHAEFTIRGFMKSSVCRGQVALNVIDDHFWVFFISPEHTTLKQVNRLVNANAEYLSLPAEAGSEAEPIVSWSRFSQLQQRYLGDKSAIINKHLDAGHRLGLDYIWDGDGNNENALLTVFRHFDSASVRQGLLGPQPKTVWLIDYSVLERIHYLLVAGFDVYGNLGHQLLTRLYMDFLRMESQFNFLTLMPTEERPRLRDHWYRESQDDIKAYIHGEHSYIGHEPGIKYQSQQPKSELLELVRDRLAPILNHEHEIESLELSPRQLAALRRIGSAASDSASLMPEMSLVFIDGEQPGLVSLLRTSAHSNVSELFAESSRRLPAEDNLIALAGVIGAYPDALWRVDATEIENFVGDLLELETEQDYRRLMQRYGVRRSNADFWLHSDRIHEVYGQIDPVGYGLLDYSRLENR
ncbi:MAG: fatty acid cis/trans isomerase [Gammaproteobacteria bacterium]|nr:fatty acid cis/trans isomerase [Gammaproteobacteria bacterium]